MRKHLQLYLKENWEELINYIHEKIEYFGFTGNSIELTRSLCQFGCYNLLISNHHTVDVIYKFIKTAYDLKSLGKQEAASATRFLALYSIFEGNIDQANSYYKESRQLFWSLDLFEEEAMMLSESYEWFYVWINNQEEMYYCLQRLRFLQKKIDSETNIYKKIEHIPIKNINEPAYYYWKLIVRNSIVNEQCICQNKTYHMYSIPSLCLEIIDCYENQDQLQQVAFTLLAQVNQFKHPFYKAYSYFLVGNSLKNNSYLLNAKNLFLQLKLPEYANLCNIELYFTRTNKVHKLTCKLFGEFEVYCDVNKVSLTKWERKKAEELLLYLLIQPNLRALKDVIIEEFYPEDDNKKASNRLYVLIHAVNNKIRNLLNNKKPLISIESGYIKIDNYQIEEIDVQNYLKLISVGNLLWSDDQAAAVELFEKARKIHNKLVMPHLLYIPWLEQFREDIKNKHIKMLEHLLTIYSDEIKKKSIYTELIDCDPLNEAFIKKYVEFLLKNGHYETAKETYLKYVQTLHDDLGLDVSDQLKNLMDVVK